MVQHVQGNNKTVYIVLASILDYEPKIVNEQSSWLSRSLIEIEGE